MTSITLSSTTEGDFYAYIKTSSKNADIGYNLTDSWDWIKMFVTNLPLCQIVSFNPPPSILFSRGTTLQTTIQVKNNSSTPRSFWIGLSFAHETATDTNWPIGYYDIEPIQTDEIPSGVTTTKTLTFTLHKNLIPGQYYAIARTWEKFNDQLYRMEGPIDNTSYYDDWITAGHIGLASFSLGQYESTANSYIEQLRDAVRVLLFKGADITDKYRNGQKPLYYFSAGVEGDVPTSPPFHFGVDGSFLMDLSDIFAITPEGQDSGWVTVWIDAGVSLGTPTCGTTNFKVNHGITYNSFNFAERAIADDRRNLSTELAIPLISVSLIDFSPSSGWSVPRIDWTGDWEQGVTVTGSSTGYIRFEVRLNAVIIAFANAEKRYKESSTRTTGEFARLLTEEFRSVFSQNLFRPATWDDGDWEIFSHQREVPLQLSRIWKEEEKVAHYFLINVPLNASKLQVQTTGGSGNADLYVKIGDRPVSINAGGYNKKSDNPNNTEDITILPPELEPGSWFIMIPTKNSYNDLQLLARITMSVPPSVPIATDPTNVTNSSFIANWNRVDGAAGYKLDVGANNIFSSYVEGYQNLDVGNVASQSVTGLSPEHQYYYRIRTYNDSGTSDNSNTISVKTLAIEMPPSAPSATAATNITISSFKANWNSVDGATGYCLDVSTNNSFSSYVSGYNNLNVSNVNSKDVTNLNSDQTYYYRVRAYNNGGTSDNSNTISVKTLATEMPPSYTVMTWDFENSIGDWINWGGGAADVSLSTEQALSGTHSLKAVGKNDHQQINVRNDVYKDLKEGDILIFYVWISTADLALINGGLIFWQDGPGWSWHSSAWIGKSAFTADGWSTFKVSIPAIADPLRTFGFQIQDVDAASTPTIYIDDITVRRILPPGEIIVIDCYKDDFYTSLTGPDDGYLQLRSYAYNENGKPDDDNDLSAKMWFAWDKNFMYFFEEVIDDIISVSGTSTWNNDGVEFRFDPQPTDSVINSVVWSPFSMTALDTTGGENGQTTITHSARKLTTDGYIIEIAIPWIDIVSGKETIDVGVGNLFGFAVQNDDNDNTIGRRDATIQWAAVLSDGVWNTPKYCGTVKFLDGNKLQFIPSNNMTGKTNLIPYDGSDYIKPPFLATDANKDDFYASLTGPNDGYLQLRSYAYNENGKPDNDADLSAKMWFAWDENWLYFYEEVKDDIISMSGTENYLNDGVEFKFDPQPTDSVTNSIVGLKMTALDTTGGKNGQTTIPNSASKLTADGYVIEIAIPWSDIVSGTETIDVGVGNIFGFAVQNHDNDNTIGKRDATIQWAAVLSDGVWNTPKYCGTVKFLKGNKLQFIPTNNMTDKTNLIPYDGSDYNHPIVDNIKEISLPLLFSLKQNYPNPFNPLTTFTYELPKESYVQFIIYDITGRLIKTLVSEKQPAGYYQMSWDAGQLGSGIYFYRISAGSFDDIKKCLLIK